jgi:hypothetical protein
LAPYNDVDDEVDVDDDIDDVDIDDDVNDVNDDIDDVVGGLKGGGGI